MKLLFIFVTVSDKNCHIAKPQNNKLTSQKFCNKVNSRYNKPKSTFETNFLKNKQDICQNKQDTGQSEQGTGQSEQDIRQSKQIIRQSEQGIRQNKQDIRQSEQDIRQTKQSIRQSQKPFIKYNETKNPLQNNANSDSTLLLL